MIEIVGTVLWFLARCPLVWAPLLTALFIWFFMAGVTIGQMRHEERCTHH